VSSEALERADGREIQHALNVLHGIQQGSFQLVSVAPALAELAGLLSALAVAREREQRATKALRAVRAGYDTFYISKKRTAERWHDLLNAERLVRAALVDEPAAAQVRP
jgi:hypothetical protein